MNSQPAPTELRQAMKELEFRMTVTSAMLGTLDLDQILYVILTGITSGDGLAFNRAFLLLEDHGRALHVTMGVGPASPEAADRIWTEIERAGLQLPDILARYESYRQEAQAQALSRRMAGFALPLHDLASIAADPPAAGEAPLAGVLARCLLDGRPYASNDVTLVVDGEMAFRHFAIVPLHAAGRLIGAILADNLYNESPVGGEKLRSLQALCHLAALAIDRARLHRRTLALAEVDGLTGVYNRRYYEQELRRLVEQRRAGGPDLSIVVFDIDHFKSCNDLHGHLCGDEVLRDVARILVDNVRQTDLVARYGGEEFVVLLPETQVDGALQVAEKLRQRVREGMLAGGKVGGVTVSAGVAGALADEDPEALFARADAALYQAKSEGRDRVVASRPAPPPAG